MPSVSVIIPVYNTEKYISRCASSLLEQTIKDIEYIFVNDCTPDNSIVILKEVIKLYPHRFGSIKIINHSTNRGSAAARNTGLEAACGDYIIHCDSDDWVDLLMYEQMYNKALEDNSDMVLCDMWKVSGNKTKYWKQRFNEDPHEYLRSLINLKSHASNCTKLIKRTIFTNHNLKYIEGIDMWEDLIIAIKTAFFSKKISYINKSFYHYEKNNPNSQMIQYTSNSLNQTIYALGEIELFLKANNKLSNYQTEINNLKFFVKYLHLKKGNLLSQKKAITLYDDLNQCIFTSNLKNTRKIKLWVLVKYPFLLPLLKIV